jgi:recombination protein RecA
MARNNKPKKIIESEDNKQKALEVAVGAIEKQFGKGSIMTGFSGKSHPGVKFSPSGCMSIDVALGGGWAKGRVHEIFGPESSGKTTLCLHAIAEVQKDGGVAAFIDAEHALDPSYASALGVDTEKLLLSQPDSGEQALEICEMLIRSNAVNIIVIDSVAALVPQKEIEGDMGDAQMGIQARLMSQAMRKLANIISKTNCMVLFINQIRMKIGVMFGNPETTTGGRALTFYASQRVDIRRTGGIKEGEELIGNSTKIRVVKNKVAPPFKEVHFDIRYGEGIDTLGDLIQLSTDIGLIDKSGSWYSYGDQRIGQGKNQVREFVKSQPELIKELTEKTNAHFGF